MTPSDPVVAVEVGQAVLPLARPLVLGPMVVREREYAAVRVRSASGHVGNACCLTRGAPLAAVVKRMLASAVVGADPLDPGAVWSRLQRSTVAVGRSGLVMRALGLVDVALWDLAARVQGVPLWRLLGDHAAEPAEPAEVDAMLVAVYPTPDREPEEMAAELERQAAAGWRMLKVARDPDRDRMRRLLAAATERLAGRARLVVDAGWAWTSAAEALDEIAAWGPVESVAWLEDPLVPEDARGMAAIRARSPMPIGAGDEATMVGTYRDLVEREAVDVVRIDVHAIGGMTPAREAVAVARDAGLPVSLHVSPETSVQLAAGARDGVSVECFEPIVPAGNPLDPAHLLWEAPPPVRPGRAAPPRDPGLGNELRWTLFQNEIARGG